MIATASFTIPYPKITENNFGWSAYFIRVRAATESVAQIVALNFIINVVVRITLVSWPITDIRFRSFIK